MDPNGRIPPRQTMTAGSMNLREIQHMSMTEHGQVFTSDPPSRARIHDLCYGKEKEKGGLNVAWSHICHFLLAAGHSARQKAVNVNALVAYCFAIFHYPKSLCWTAKTFSALDTWTRGLQHLGFISSIKYNFLTAHWSVITRPSTTINTPYAICWKALRILHSSTEIIT